MKFRDYLFLFIFSLLALSAVAYFQRTPGYMDADYYMLGGVQLAAGEGFVEPVLWNYLDDPAGLPHPSHGYWMPLASLVAVLGIWTAPLGAFSGARIGFLLLGALVAPLTASLSFSLTPRRSAAFLSGLLAIFSGFYLAFMPTTDTFALYMVLGAILIRIASSYKDAFKKGRIAFLMGLVIGLMHLARADGASWLAAALILVIFTGDSINWQNWKTVIGLCLLVFAGYIIIMGPWMARNMNAFGSLLAPGGSASLWQIEYNDLFVYPASEITFDRWASRGIGQILGDRIWAFGQNLQTFIAVQGSIFLSPLIVLGLWKLRQKRGVQFGIFGWFVTLAAMTLAFPFAGTRGGFFHSGAALQPLFWSAVPVGLEAFVEWGGQKRGWRVKQAEKVFRAGLVALALLLSGVLAWQNVIGPNPAQPVWNAVQETYASVEAALPDGYEDFGRGTVMVNNPPGYALASGGRNAVVVPVGDENSLISAAKRFHVAYILLDANHPPELGDLYENPENAEGLTFLGTEAGVHIFRVTP